MHKIKLLENVEDINNLAQILSRSPKVNACDDTENKECWTMAHSFGDLEQSFLTFLNVHLPKLMNDNLKSKEIENVLFDIGQEFCHILYHIYDPKYFEHILPPSKGKL